MRYLFYIFSLVVITKFSFAKNIVPVLVWNSNQHAETLPALSALQTLSYKQFKTEYLSQFGASGLPKNILLFLQDSLSVEDLSSHAQELKFLSSQMKKGHYLFMPRVENAGYLHSDLHTHGYNLINLEPRDSIAGITLKKNSSNLVAVQLPSTATNPSRSKALLKTAEVMQNVISKIGDLSQFTMMFTGLEASVRTDLSSDHERFRRSELKISDNKIAKIPNFHRIKCVLLYFRHEAVLTIKDSEMDNITRLDLTNYTAEEDKADCQPNITTFHWKFLTIEKFPKIFISILFELINDGHWRAFQAEYESDSSKTTLNITRKMMWVPLGYSYSCSLGMTFESNASVFPYYRLDINGIQMQPFFTFKPQTSFGDSWDCVGFFTIPIWSGLIVTFMLVIILGWGMNMLAEIKTMDRFDDPKGKHILVPATAE